MARSIISLFFLGVAAVVFFAFSRPNFDAVKALREKQAAFDSVLASSKQLQKIRDDVLAQYNSITQSDLDRLNKLLPSRMKPIKIVLEIENMAKKHNLILKNVDVKRPPEKKKDAFGEKKEPYEAIPISISVVGPYDSFIPFLGDLQRSLSLIDVTRLGFSSGKGDSYDYGINALTYWKR